MSDEFIFGADTSDDEVREPSRFLTPATGAIAALALAVTALLGQNVVALAMSVLFGPQFGNDGLRSYYVALGAGTLGQAILALLLAGRASRSDGWEGHLGRAAVLVGAVALLAGLATVLGALLHDPSSMG
jgi:MFS family permease